MFYRLYLTAAQIFNRIKVDAFLVLILPFRRFLVNLLLLFFKINNSKPLPLIRLLCKRKKAVTLASCHFSVSFFRIEALVNVIILVDRITRDLLFSYIKSCSIYSQNLVLCINSFFAQILLYRSLGLVVIHIVF